MPLIKRFNVDFETNANSYHSFCVFFQPFLILAIFTFLIPSSERHIELEFFFSGHNTSSMWLLNTAISVYSFYILKRSQEKQGVFHFYHVVLQLSVDRVPESEMVTGLDL